MRPKTSASRGEFPAVFRLLSNHVPPGEMDDVTGPLPKEQREFFAESVHASA